MQSALKRRKTKKFCPGCGREKLLAGELPDGTVTHYECVFCGEYYDAFVSVDMEADSVWRLGFRRNPEFWTFSFDTVSNRIEEMNRRLESGVPQYNGIYPMERVYSEKN